MTTTNITRWLTRMCYGAAMGLCLLLLLDTIGRPSPASSQKYNNCSQLASCRAWIQDCTAHAGYEAGYSVVIDSCLRRWAELSYRGLTD